MKKKVIYGPPGTGKTTYLMSLLETKLEDYDAERIAFVSFTQQGTYEGVKRAIAKFSLKGSQTQYFRTIHSLCFRQLGIHKSMMVGKNHYKILSEATGLPFVGYYTEEYMSDNDRYIHALSMNKHNPEYGQLLLRDLSARKYNYIDFQYNEMKKQMGLRDYDDLLLDYLEFGKPLDIDIAFVDEGQDLTPLQWKVVNKLFANAQEIYVAGDDDQAVYEWSGARVDQFMGFSDDCMVLNKSYRLPENILRLAKNITKDIVNRKFKAFTDKGDPGVILTARQIYDIDFKGGELVLARTNWLLKKMAKDFSTLGIPYELKGKLSIDKRIVNAINAHVQFELGSIEDLGHFKSYFKNESRNPWQKTIDLSPEEITHYDTVLLYNRIDMPPVLFKTFHSSKGSENSHVILSPDMSNKVYKNLAKNRDSELRCLYVGMTRTDNKLTILMPKEKRFYPAKYFS